MNKQTSKPQTIIVKHQAIEPEHKNAVSIFPSFNNDPLVDLVSLLDICWYYGLFFNSLIVPYYFIFTFFNPISWYRYRFCYRFRDPRLVQKNYHLWEIYSVIYEKSALNVNQNVWSPFFRCYQVVIWIDDGIHNSIIQNYSVFVYYGYDFKKCSVCMDSLNLLIQIMN